MTGPQGFPSGVAPAGPPGSFRVPPALLRQTRSPLSWVSMVVLGAGALVIGLLLVLNGGPAELLLTTILAALSLPVVLLICFWLDRYEPEPARYRIAALGWGGVVAVSLSLIAEQVLFALPGTDDVIDTIITAPLVEEFGKGLFLVVIVILRRSQVHGVLDGIVYAALVGIGFAFVEDIVYYLSALDAGELPATFFLRGVMGPFAHPLFTAATGVGIGIAATTRRPGVRLTAPILGYLVAVLTHALWNGSALWGGRGFLFAYVVVILPLLGIVLGLAIWARWREGKLLATALTQVAQFGWIRPDEIRWVARLSDRLSARSYAKRVGGKQAARALAAYQQTLIEIAFLHSRAVHGTPPRDINQRMDMLLRRAAQLRPYVILPQPTLRQPGPTSTWPPSLPPPPMQQPGQPRNW
ncbi:MAG TPA: PrsW family intramembrane metalloprotease [Propionibacteriaceae bacterium]|nr:PrsW family intramembrane metalloprotease [Propionibacteriaceae bacterium]